MNMKITVAITLTFIIGFAAGWLSFRSKEMSKAQDLMTKSGITHEQMIDAYKSIPTILENIESDDRMSTVISLTALSMLENNKIKEAKQLLARQPASYFILYGPPNNPKKKITEEKRSTLLAIEKVRQQSPLLDAEITASLKNVKQ